jgi:hypothetical protein
VPTNPCCVFTLGGKLRGIKPVALPVEDFWVLANSVSGMVRPSDGALAHEGIKERIDLAARAGFEDMDLQPGDAGK